MNVEQDVKRIFRLNEEQLGNLKLRTLEAVKERKKAFRVRWLDDCTQIGDIVQFNEDYFSEQLTSLTNIPTTTDATSSKLIDDEFSEPHEDKDAHTEFHTGDEVFLLRLSCDTDLNAQEGVVIEMPNDMGKYLVKLHQTGEEVLVTERNMSRMKNNEYHIGDEVFLSRLSSDTDLNAQEGVVIAMPNDMGKYLVKLHQSGEEVLVMERN